MSWQHQCETAVRIEHTEQCVIEVPRCPEQVSLANGLIAWLITLLKSERVSSCAQLVCSEQILLGQDFYAEATRRAGMTDTRNVPKLIPKPSPLITVSAKERSGPQ